MAYVNQPKKRRPGVRACAYVRVCLRTACVYSRAEDTEGHRGTPGATSVLSSALNSQDGALRSDGCGPLLNTSATMTQNKGATHGEAAVTHRPLGPEHRGGAEQQPTCFITLPPSANEHIYSSSKCASGRADPAHGVHQTLWQPLIITRSPVRRRAGGW